LNDRSKVVLEKIKNILDEQKTLDEGLKKSENKI